MKEKEDLLALSNIFTGAGLAMILTYLTMMPRNNILADVIGVAFLVLAKLLNHAAQRQV